VLDHVVAAVTAIAEPIARQACASFPTLECCDVLAEIHLAWLERATRDESLVSSERVLAVAFGVAARCMQEERRRLRMLAQLRDHARLHPDGVLLQ